MALAELTGNVRDFTNSNIDDARMWVHPLQSSVGNFTLFADKPLEIEIGTNGVFTVQLQEHNRYRLEVVFPDPEHIRMGLSILGEFRMPVGGGQVGAVIGPPASNGMVRITQAAPTETTFDQYVYNETTGDLFERTA